jgi:two-component system nitrate/nitrite response regulator NarL
MADKIRVVLADDHPMIREGVCATLAAEPDMEVVAECATADEAVAAVQEFLPDIALLDVSMPGGGLNAARAISATCPVVGVLMFTVSENQDDVTAALEAGARGYILKGVGGDELVGIVRDTHRGESYVSPELAARLLKGLKSRPDPRDPADPFSDLTVREEQILKGVSQGLSNKEIARQLDLSDKTVKHYMTNVLQKLQVRNRVEAAIRAREHYATE